MKSLLALTMTASALAMLSVPAMAQDTNCAALSGLKLDHAKVDSATPVAAGPFAQPGGRAGRTDMLPAFCLVALTAAPTSDSDIKMEVWLPANWNGKFLVVGNGGWAGTIGYSALGAALTKGYATAGSDTGHTVNDGSFVPGHPEKMIDFAWRSEHETAVQGKAVVAAFYSKPAARSYWEGCSTGGRQGLMEATRFPDDFDGIVAGDPVTPRSVHDAWSINAILAVSKDPAMAIPLNKYALIHQGALAACDAKDGVKDGLITDPMTCKFNPAVLLCKNGDAPDCLTAGQVKTANLLLSPAMSKGKVFYPGLLPGSEVGWREYAVGGANQPGSAGNFKYVVFKNSDWDWKSFNADSDLDPARAADRDESVASFDLSAFTAHGGKLILYHGLSDPLVSPLGSLQLYRDITKDTKDAAQSVRLFYVPGMGHCGGGAGATDKFDAASALDAWVEKGAAPARITAANITNGEITRTRPLCAYPQQASYVGKGSTDDAANFVCKAPK